MFLLHFGEHAVSYKKHFFGVRMDLDDVRGLYPLLRMYREVKKKKKVERLESDVDTVRQRLVHALYGVLK